MALLIHQQDIYNATKTRRCKLAPAAINAFAQLYEQPLAACLKDADQFWKLLDLTIKQNRFDIASQLLLTCPFSYSAPNHSTESTSSTALHQHGNQAQLNSHSHQIILNFAISMTSIDHSLIRIPFLLNCLI